MSLSRERWPRTIVTLVGATPTRLATKRHSARFARPSSAGAATRASSTPPRIATSSSRRARACTRTDIFALVTARMIAPRHVIRDGRLGAGQYQRRCAAIRRMHKSDHRQHARFLRFAGKSPTGSRCAAERERSGRGRLRPNLILDETGTQAYIFVSLGPRSASRSERGAAYRMSPARSCSGSGGIT